MISSKTSRQGTGYFIRMSQPWRIVSVDKTMNRVAFNRFTYDQTRRPLKNGLWATVDFSSSGISLSARRALVGCVRIGKISPNLAQGIVDEYRLSVGPSGKIVATLHALLMANSPSLRDVFRDPMRGILTTPFHQGLFGENVDFVEAIDDLATNDEATERDTLGQYIELYLRCRRLLVGLAFNLERGMPAIQTATWTPSEDFFVWWRSQWIETIEIQYSPDAAPVSFQVPANLPEAKSASIRRAVTVVAQEYDLLASTLGRPQDTTASFIQSFVAELLDGLSGLLLNRFCEASCLNGSCPGDSSSAFDGVITTTIISAAGHPTRSRYLKEVHVGQVKFHDVFSRFFALPRQDVSLTKDGFLYSLDTLGTCPFPDRGYLWVAEIGEEPTT
jgi:hypothetical protein